MGMNMSPEMMRMLERQLGGQALPNQMKKPLMGALGGSQADMQNVSTEMELINQEQPIPGSPQTGQGVPTNPIPVANNQELPNQGVGYMQNAYQERANLQAGNASAQASPGEFPTMPSSQAGGLTEATAGDEQRQGIHDKSVWDSMLNALSGENLGASANDERFRDRMTLGTVGNAMASAIAGDSPVGRMAGSLRDSFAGALVADEAEQNSAKTDNFMQSAYAQLLKNIKTSPASSAGYQASGSSVSAPSIGSGNLATSSTGNSTLANQPVSMADLHTRIRKLNGIT